MHIDSKSLETAEIQRFETSGSDINNQENWLLDLYRKSISL